MLDGFRVRATTDALTIDEPHQPTALRQLLCRLDLAVTGKDLLDQGRSGAGQSDDEDRSDTAKPPPASADEVRREYLAYAFAESLGLTDRNAPRRAATNCRAQNSERARVVAVVLARLSERETEMHDRAVRETLRLECALIVQIPPVQSETS